MTPRPAPTSEFQIAIRSFKKAGGLLRAKEALAAGIHPRTLAAMTQAAVIDRIGRGLYQLRGSHVPHPDLVIATRKAPHAIVCLISALALHDLTTQIPHRVDLAIAPGARALRFDYPPTRFYRFGGSALTEGVEHKRLGQATIPVFSAAKSIADCFKFRNRVGIDVAIESLRAYLNRRGATTEEIMHYAGVDRVQRIIIPYIEAVL